jgi:hypothetical protein
MVSSFFGRDGLADVIAPTSAGSERVKTRTSEPGVLMALARHEAISD